MNTRIVLWFKYPNLLISGDFRLPVNIHAFITYSLFLWNNIDFGLYSVYIPRILNPCNLLYVIFSSFNFPPTYAQLLSTYLIYCLFSVVVFKVFKEITDSKLGGFVSTIFIQFCPLLLNDREMSAIGYIALYLLPSLIPVYFFINYLKKGNTKYALLSGITATLTVSTFPNYKPLLLCAGFILITSLYYTFSHYTSMTRSSLKGKLRRIIKGALLVITSFLLSNVWILYIIWVEKPLLLGTLNRITIPLFAYNINPLDIFRFLAKWTLYTQVLGRRYIPYADPYFKDPVLIFASYFPTLLGLITPFIVKDRGRKIASTVLCIIMLFGFFLAMGYYLWGQLYLDLVKMPALRTFREPIYWLFFSAFTLAGLLGILTSDLYSLLQETRRRTFGILVIAAMVILPIMVSYPLVNGDVGRNWLDTSQQGYPIPVNEYLEADSKLTTVGWTLILPHLNTYVTFNDSGKLYELGNPWPILISKPFISGDGSEYVHSRSEPLIEKLYRLLTSRNTNISKALGFFGIKHLLYVKNVIIGIKGSYATYTTILKELTHQNNTVLIEENDVVSLYTIKHALPIIYAASRIDTYNNIDDLFQHAIKEPWEKLKHSAFISQTEIKDIIKYLSTNTHSLKEVNNKLTSAQVLAIHVLSPTHYKVRIKSSGPFILILLQNFDNGWELYVNSTLINKHFEVNGFANGWIITNKGMLNVDIVFTPQYTLERIMICNVVLIISFLTIYTTDA